MCSKKGLKNETKNETQTNQQTEINKTQKQTQTNTQTNTNKQNFCIRCSDPLRNSKKAGFLCRMCGLGSGQKNCAKMILQNNAYSSSSSAYSFNVNSAMKI